LGGYSSIPFQPQDPSESIRNIVALRGLMQGQQLQQQQVQAAQLENQQRQYNFAATRATNQAYQNAIKIDENGHPTFDENALTKSLSDAGFGSEAPTILQHLTDYQKSRADLNESQNKIQNTSKDAMGALGRAVQAAKYDPALTQTIIEHGLSDPTLTPQGQQQLQQMRTAIGQNPDLIKQWADNAVMQSPKQQELANAREVATIRASKPPEGELPLGDKVPQLNAALTQRYQVLNPGKELPAFYQLPADATQKDYDRIDKSLAATEGATATKAQQETANQIRQQTLELAQEGRAEKKETEGLQWVTGTDPKTGKDVLVPLSQGKTMGLADMGKADTDLVNKAHAGRTWLQLATQQAPDGAPPDQMGIMQLIDRLDREGKLGPVASRWEDFLAGKVGAGDPEYAALRAKMGLSTTKLMQAHVGSRGGSFMLEHFEDLANAKKMDAATLKAGVASEINYVNDVAMLPNAPTNQRTAAPTPQSHDFSISAWQRANPGGNVAAARAAAGQKGYNVVP